MALIKWNPRYSIGHSEIDDQHKKLLAIFNHAHDMYLSGVTHQEILTIFHQLIVYTVDHFQDEEKIMLKMNVPDLDRHKLEHQELADRLHYIVDKYAHKDTAMHSLADTMDLLKDWLLGHTLGSDISSFS